MQVSLLSRLCTFVGSLGAVAVMDGCTPERIIPPHEPTPFPDGASHLIDAADAMPTADLFAEDIPIRLRPYDVSEPRVADTEDPDLTIQPPLDETTSPPEQEDIPIVVADASLGEDTGPDIPVDTGPDLTPCVPTLCEGYLDLKQPGPNPGEFMCLALADETDSVGIEGDGDFRAVAAAVFVKGGLPSLAVVPEEGPVTLWKNTGGKFTLLPLPGSPDTVRFIALGDFNADGWPDLAAGNETEIKVFLNDQTGLLIELAGAIPFDGTFKLAQTAAAVGPHLLVGTDSGLLFYQQQANGEFLEKGASVGLLDIDPIVALAVASFDGDLLPDVYAVKNTKNNRLFRQGADGLFTSVADTFGVPGPKNSTHALFFSIQPGDLSSLLVLNSPWQGPLLEGSKFYVNNGTIADKTPKFSEQAAAYGLATPAFNVFAAAGNFLNNGRPAIFIGRSNETDAPVTDAGLLSELLMVPIVGESGFVTHYEDRADALGLKGPQTTRGGVFTDWSGDGWEDLVVARQKALRVYRNKSGWVQTCL